MTLFSSEIELQDCFTELSQKVSQKNAVLGIVGLGYVGVPLAVASCTHGVRTVCFDVDTQKINALKNGVSYISSVSDEKIISLCDSGLFMPTANKNDLKQADFILLCVPTPLTKNHTPDMSYVISASQLVASILRKGQVVILESTTYPGTTNDLIIPILETSGLIYNQDFFVAYSPEREDPGNKQFNTHTIPKIVGADDKRILDLTASFYRHFIKKIVTVSSTKTAESVKLMENIFRCVNIALVNEMKMIFDNMDIDTHEVIHAAATKPFGFMPFYPGPGIGGHCIPIDPLYLTWKNREYKSTTRFIELATEINQSMPAYVVQKFSESLNDKLGKAFKGAKILVVGLAYKKNVSDCRESPAADVIRLLKQRHADISYYDPYIASVDNTEFEGIPTIEWNADSLKLFDAAIILTDHDCIDWKFLTKNCFVFDTRNVLSGHIMK
jgi:UDP-N-acetyl-D-glucosamine dehydrogenase